MRTCQVGNGRGSEARMDSTKAKRVKLSRKNTGHVQIGRLIKHFNNREEDVLKIVKFPFYPYKFLK